jgi:hypothetical protein
MCFVVLLSDLRLAPNSERPQAIARLVVKTFFAQFCRPNRWKHRIMDGRRLTRPVSSSNINVFIVSHILSFSMLRLDDCLHPSFFPISSEACPPSISDSSFVFGGFTFRSSSSCFLRIQKQQQTTPEISETLLQAQKQTTTNTTTTTMFSQNISCSPAVQHRMSAFQSTSCLLQVAPLFCSKKRMCLKGRVCVILGTPSFTFFSGATVR